MAYYLTIKENSNYKLLDISMLDNFTRITNFKGSAYSLEEIDNFTSSFESEISMRRKLYDNGVITLEEITKDITVRRKEKDKMEKVTYGLVFKDMKKYLDDYYLRITILNLREDHSFLNKLLTHYRNSYCNQEALMQIRALLLGYDGGEINMYEALTNFFSKEVYVCNYSTGVVKIKYKSLHDLGMFVYNYISKKDKSEIAIIQDELGRTESLTCLKNALTEREQVPLPKKKVKKLREELEGQTSFF